MQDVIQINRMAKPSYLPPKSEGKLSSKSISSVRFDVSMAQILDTTFSLYSRRTQKHDHNIRLKSRTGLKSILSFGILQKQRQLIGRLTIAECT